MPHTTAAAIINANEAKCTASARIAIPAMRTAHPNATARCGSARSAASCASADDAKIEQTIAPAVAWLSMPTTSDRNDGATAVNSPVVAKPANPANAATTNTARACGGTASR